MLILWAHCATKLGRRVGTSVSAYVGWHTYFGLATRVVTYGGNIQEVAQLAQEVTHG